jgi:hypothetical protein
MEQDLKDFSKHIFGPIALDMEADEKLDQAEEDGKAHEKEGWNVVAHRPSTSKPGPIKRNRGSRQTGRGHGSKHNPQ